MALSLALTKADMYRPASTVAKVHLEKYDGGYRIPLIELQTEGEVPGIDDAEFQKLATATKSGCPVSKALSAVEMKLDANFWAEPHDRSIRSSHRDLCRRRRMFVRAVAGARLRASFSVG